ncbi:acyl-CoA dehydrogenase family protein [Paenibacillus sp. sgz302251]|uniref:acyl-CoA dehydrogenase family protein n=1 Tax=Paenibacillus sp. sgz302251 TaxID=3414493 RepID=UPI003C7BA173
MELRYTREQDKLRLEVKHFAETELAPAVSFMELHDEFPTGQLKRMAELGFMGIPIAKQWGGGGSLRRIRFDGLSFDRSVLDEEVSSQFINRVKDYLEEHDLDAFIL